MKTIFSCLLLLALLAGQAQAAGRAGIQTAYLNCASDSGRTIFQAEIGDIDGLIDTARFSIDGHSQTWSDIDFRGSQSAILVNLDYRVFTLWAQKSEPFAFVELIADPSSMRVNNNRDALSVAFRATIVGTEPRPNQDSLRSKNILLNCNLHYKNP